MPAKKADQRTVIEIDGDNAKNVRKVAELLEKRRLERLVEERAEAEERLERLKHLAEKRVKAEVEYLYDTESEMEDIEVSQYSPISDTETDWENISTEEHTPTDYSGVDGWYDNEDDFENCPEQAAARSDNITYEDRPSTSVETPNKRRLVSKVLCYDLDDVQGKTTLKNVKGGEAPGILVQSNDSSSEEYEAAAKIEAKPSTSASGARKTKARISVYDPSRLGAQKRPGPKSMTAGLTAAAVNLKPMKRRTALPRSKIMYDPEGDEEEDGRNLTNKQYLHKLVAAEKVYQCEVVDEEPFSFAKETTDFYVRPSTKMFNDPNENPYNKHTEIRVHTVHQRGLRYRPINEIGQGLIAASLNQSQTFTESDRAMYKMLVIQMVDNLNYISAKYAHKRIKLQNPTKMIKKKLLHYYH